MSAVQANILERIEQAGRGKVYTVKDFLMLGSRAAVDQALGRLTDAETIRRLGRGLYYYPRHNDWLGIEVGPIETEIAQALARQVGARIVPSGATAANMLGLSTQVPAKLVFLTDGRSREVRADERTFSFKHVGPKDLPSESYTAALVVQALRWVGRNAIDDEVIARLRAVLPKQERTELLRETQYATGWITEVVRQVVEEKQET